MWFNIQILLTINALLLTLLTEQTESVCNARQCAFVARHGMTFASATAQAQLRRSQGFTLRTLDGYHNGQESRFVGLWEKCANEKFYNYVVLPLSYGELKIELVQRELNGYCLDFINAFNLPDDKQRYIGMWSFKNGNCGDLTREFVDITGDQYQELFDFLTQTGYRIHWLSGNMDVNEKIPKYTAIFKKGIQYNFASFHGLTASDYQEKFDTYVPAGYRLIWRNGFMVNGLARFNALFENSPGRRFAARFGLKSQKYQCTFDNYVYSGYAPKYVTGYGDGTPSTSIRYGAIWELDVMSWEDLQWIDQQVEDLQNAFPMYDNIDEPPPNPLNTMAVSFGISIFGKTVFAKGYGKAAIDDDEDACPNTMYRTASLGKSLTSAGILYLEQTGLLSLDDNVFGTNGILTPAMGYVLPSNGNENAIASITIADLLPHLSRLKRKKIASTTAAGAIKDALDDDDLLTDSNIGEEYLYSNLGYNILGQVIAEKGEEFIGTNSYEDFVRNILLSPAGIDIDIPHSPRIGTYDESTRVAWQEAQYHPNPGTFPDFLRVYEGAGGWIMSPLHLLKFMATIDRFSLVDDILDEERIGLLETPIDVDNNERYMEGGGWTVTPSGDDIIGREHGGSWWIGTRTTMAIRNNGKAGAMFANYNNDGDVGVAVRDTLDTILDNSDITWPCWTNNGIRNTVITNVAAPGQNTPDADEGFATEFVVNEREQVITQYQLKKYLRDIGSADANRSDTEADNGPDFDNDTTATFVSPPTRRNPLEPETDYELCPTDPNPCGSRLFECEDGTLVGMDPDNDCELFDCPEEEQEECDPAKLECDDGSYVFKNASNDCQFDECPPCNN